MQTKRTRHITFAGFAALLFVLSGCFQSAGSNPDALSQVDTGPTFTAPPPLVVTQEIVITATPDPNLVPLDASAPTFDASTLFQQSPTPFNLVQDAAGGPLDPLDITATFIVQNATNEAALILTQDAMATAGFTTPIATAPFATATTPGIVLPGGPDCIHEVQATDANVFRISLLYGVSVDDIARATPLTNPSLIHVGDKLVIPGCGTTGHIPPATSVPSGGTGGPITGGSSYTVVQGDTLFGISMRYSVPMASIASVNGISNWNLIIVGQVLTIPAQ
jgi:LysM repeat protein